MLSGFVLYLPFVNGRPFNTIDFYWHRLARLYPLYILAALTSIYIYSNSNTMDPAFWRHIVEAAGVTFFFTDRGSSVVGNGPMWSLAIEFYMSALFPLIVIAINRRSALAVAIGFFIINAIAKTLYNAVMPPNEASAFVLFGWKLLLILQGLTEFSIGMWLAHLWSRGQLSSLQRYAAPLFIVSGIALIWLVTLQPTNHGRHPFGIHSLFWPTADLLLALVVASALALPRGITRFCLTAWPLQMTGAMCFSIYVWHMLVFAAVSYRFIEFPGQPWRKLFLIGPTKSSEIASHPAPAFDPAPLEGRTETQLATADNSR